MLVFYFLSHESPCFWWDSYIVQPLLVWLLMIAGIIGQSQHGDAFLQLFTPWWDHSNFIVMFINLLVPVAWPVFGRNQEFLSFFFFFAVSTTERTRSKNHVSAGICECHPPGKEGFPLFWHFGCSGPKTQFFEVWFRITSQRLLDQSQAGVYRGKHHIPPHFGFFGPIRVPYPKGLNS